MDAEYKEVRAKEIPKQQEYPATECISIMSNTRYARVPIKDIELIEQESRRLHIITGDDEYICYERIERLSRLLGEGNFYKAMKSIIVNFDRVKEVTGQEVVFVSGRKLCMGKNNLMKLRKAFKYYLLQYPPFGSIQVARVSDRTADYGEDGTSVW